MTPSEMRRTLLEMQKSLNALTVCSIGVNNSIAQVLTTTDQNSQCSLEELMCSVNQLGNNLWCLNEALNRFLDDSAPFINGG